MMAKVTFEEWKKFSDERDNTPREVELKIGDNKLLVHVKPRLTYTELVMMEHEIIRACSPLVEGYEYDEGTSADMIAAHRKPNEIYLEGVLRATVVKYYTDLDIEDERATIDEIWGLVGNEDVWGDITREIKDDITVGIYYTVENIIHQKSKNQDILAARILALIDVIMQNQSIKKAMSGINDLLAQAEELNLDAGELLKIASGEDNAD